MLKAVWVDEADARRISVALDVFAAGLVNSSDKTTYRSDELANIRALANRFNRQFPPEDFAKGERVWD